MLSTKGSRVMLRQTRSMVRQLAKNRKASTQDVAANASSKSKESASNVQSKASQGLSKVTSSAGPAISGAAQGVSNQLNKIGGRTGRLISRIQSLIPPIVYYSKVGLEMSKIVFKGRQMYPPDAVVFSRHLEPFYNALKHPASTIKSLNIPTNNPEAVLNQMRNISSQQMATAGIVFAEVLGFFTIGEVIGRLKFIGYHGEVHHDEH